MSAAPTLDRERALWSQHTHIVALDEVGRGALAGPVAVGAVLLRADAGDFPAGLRDSKLIAESRRADMAERAAAWVASSAVGWASAAEIDHNGIMWALGAAAVRAIARLDFDADDASIVIALDGNHDYVTRALARPVRVVTVVKGDRDCASIAAASVIAKVARDDQMRALHEEHPVYLWERNKGYASAAHRQSIAQHGPSAHHRVTWLRSGS